MSSWANTVLAMQPADALEAVAMGEDGCNYELVNEVAGRFASRQQEPDLADAGRVAWIRVALAALQRTARTDEDKLTRELFHRSALIDAMGGSSTDELCDLRVIVTMFLNSTRVSPQDARERSLAFAEQSDGVAIVELQEIRTVKNRLKSISRVRRYLPDGDDLTDQVDAWMAVNGDLVRTTARCQEIKSGSFA